jgi:SNF2 family DNA or RNA helicase
VRTYGTIKRTGREWIIECEPQVTLRLKRLFGKVNRAAQGSMSIADTLETGRDLCWFEGRYPMVMSDVDREYLGTRDAQHKELTEDIGRILGSGYVPRDVPLALPLRDYQSVGVDLIRRVRGLLVADDVGTGKTAIGIGLLADPATRPALVVTLTHLPRQWKSEIDRFCPGLRIHILKKGTPYDFTAKGDLFNPGGLPDVIVTNYHKLNGWAGELKGKIKTVIFDEIQELCHTESQKYHAAEHIAAHADLRMGLSATPIHNYGGEIYNVLNILRPWALGHWSEFAQEWCGGFTDRGKAAIKDPKAFGSYAREAGLMLRRTRSDVGRELPGLTIVPHVIEADTAKLDEIAGSAGDLARVILAQGGAAFDKMRASEEFSWRLRQATGIAKAPFVADFVRLLVEDGEKVLLYGWHHEVYRIWGERLKDLSPVFFTGEESTNQKEESKRKFVDGESKVLIMSLRAGAGIDGLQKVCRTVVTGELDWSPLVHEQGTGRVFRDGQPDKVVSYFLMADSGSDPVIADVLGVKRGQLDGIRNQTGDIIEVSQTDPNRIKRLAEDFLARHAGARKKQEEDAA